MTFRRGILARGALAAVACPAAPLTEASAQAPDTTITFRPPGPVTDDGSQGVCELYRRGGPPAAPLEGRLADRLALLSREGPA